MKAKHPALNALHSYKDAYQHLCKFTDYERMAKIRYNQAAYNLKRMRQLLAYINNPQNSLRHIHIAGTKGKGSTAMMLATILSQAEYKTGLYTSPHLVDLRERIQIWHGNKQTPISKNNFTGLMNHILDSVKRLSLKPTFFELMTAIGFLHFAREKVDIAVIEVGLGGRLDATNVITPIASIITRVDFDHMDKLGRTLKQIAYEKSGIIKKDVPVISFKQKTIADKIIRSTAKTKQAPLYLANLREHHLPILGCHQSENWSLALKTVEVMNKQGVTTINPAVIKSAMKRLALPGRMELISGQPDIIIDSAHNPVSIKATAETARKLKYQKIILVFALSSDKAVGKIIERIVNLSEIIIFTRTDHPRLLPPQEFIRYLPGRPDKTVFIEPDYINALNIARRLAGHDSLILITGSFYLAGAIKQILAPGKNRP